MVKPLDYDTKLNIAEAEERLTDIREEFGRIKNHYSGLLRRFKKNMKEKDQDVLNDCMSVLLPLSMQRSIQEQIKHVDEYGDTVSHRVNESLREIGVYLAGFRNTEVTMVQGAPFP